MSKAGFIEKGDNHRSENNICHIPLIRERLLLNYTVSYDKYGINIDTYHPSQHCAYYHNNHEILIAILFNELLEMREELNHIRHSKLSEILSTYLCKDLIGELLKYM